VKVAINKNKVGNTNNKVGITRNKVVNTNVKVGITKNKVGNTNIKVCITKNKVGITNIKVGEQFSSGTLKVKIYESRESQPKQNSQIIMIM
jgi:hypothetical protein